MADLEGLRRVATSFGRKIYRAQKCHLISAIFFPTKSRVGTSLLFKSPRRASMNTRPTGRASYSLFHNFMNLYPVHTICQTK